MTYTNRTGDNAIQEWNARTEEVTTLVASGLSKPTGVAVDAAPQKAFGAAAA
jgi:hypothetical protein